MVVMPRRFNRSNALRPIHSIKHVVDVQGGSPVGVTTANTLINTIDAPTLGNTPSVETGCRINGIYLNVEAYATSTAALSNIYMIIVKNPGGNLAIIPPNVVGADDNKRYVIHQEMKMLEKKVSGLPRTIFNGVIMIPRSYRRFGINDILQILLLAPGVNVDFCIQCIYKELR